MDMAEQVGTPRSQIYGSQDGRDARDGAQVATLSRMEVQFPCS